MSVVNPNEVFGTSCDVKDPEVLPEIVGWKVLVRPVVAKEKTQGGIILPDKIKDDISYLSTVGRVLKMGEMAYKDAKFGKPWCKVGDNVVYGKFAGKKIVYRGVKMLLLNDDDIEMVVENQSDLDINAVALQ